MEPSGQFPCKKLLPSLLPSFKGSTLFAPESAWSSAQAFYFLRLLKVPQDSADHIPANAWTGALEICQSKFAWKSFYSRFNQFGFRSSRTFYLSNPFFKLTISSFENIKDIVHIRPGVVFAAGSTQVSQIPWGGRRDSFWFRWEMTKGHHSLWSP